MKSDLFHQKTVLLQVLLWNLALFVRARVVVAGWPTPARYSPNALIMGQMRPSIY